jgi:hypothetical protein
VITGKATEIKNQRRTVMANKRDEVPTMSLNLTAPVDLFERIDRWREQWRIENNKVIAPTRSATIRWIVHNFLLKQEQKSVHKAGSKAPPKKRKAA